MTVGELKKALQETPDDFPVMLVEQKGTEFNLRDMAYASELQDDTGENWDICALIPANEGLCIHSGYLGPMCSACDLEHLVDL
jgi:hypothetical protein